MKRPLVALLVILGSLPAAAQTAFPFKADGKPLGAGALNAAGASKQDVMVNLGPGFTGTVVQFLTGAAPITGLNIAAGQRQTIIPIGNDAPTLASLVAQGSTAESTVRQFMAVLGMTSNRGGSCTGLQCGAVTLYTSMDQQAGSSDAWTQNVLCRAGPGVAKYLQCMEVDVDNARGDSPLGAGNFVGGITLTGTNTQPSYLNRHALMVSSGSPNALWHVGLLGDANYNGGSSVKEALIYDQGAGGTFSYWNQSAHSGATFFDTGTTPVSMALSGTFSRAAVATENATTPMALSAAPGQKVCFASGHACAWYDSAVGKWFFTDENDVKVLSIAKTTGNAVFKGTVTQNGSP